MYIQQANAIQGASGVTPGGTAAATEQAGVARQAATSGPSGAITLSQESKSLAYSTAVYTMETGAGRRDVDLDSYFKPGGQLQDGLLDVGALLVPNAENVKALQQHISQRFPEFLADHGIPEAPEKIEFDQNGQWVLPADYAYTDQLKAALAEDDEMQRMLSTVNALSSHLAAIQALQPMHDALDQAGSEAEVKQILERFSHLLGDNASYPPVSLAFDSDGRLTMMSNGHSLV